MSKWILVNMEGVNLGKEVRAIARQSPEALIQALLLIYSRVSDHERDGSRYIVGYEPPDNTEEAIRAEYQKRETMH